MKQLFVTLVFFSFFSNIFSQTLPNNDFQTWISETNYENPEYWSTANPFTAGSPIFTTTVTKSTDAYSGDYSAFLETKDILGGTFQVPGLITLADLTIDFLNVNFSISGGLALQENVIKLTGMYKYDGANGDSATALIYNFAHNDEEIIDTIGFGLTYLHDTSQWAPFTVDMNYLNTNTPDTFNVLILSSAFDMEHYQFMTGSRLYIDSLAIETNTGVIPLPFVQEQLTVFPNPATTEITFKSENNYNDTYIEIYTLNGHQILSAPFESGNITLKVDNIISGQYVYLLKKKNIIKARGLFTKK